MASIIKAFKASVDVWIKSTTSTYSSKSHILNTVSMNALNCVHETRGMRLYIEVTTPV